MNSQKSQCQGRSEVCCRVRAWCQGKSVEEEVELDLGDTGQSLIDRNKRVGRTCHVPQRHPRSFAFSCLGIDSEGKLRSGRQSFVQQLVRQFSLLSSSSLKARCRKNSLSELMDVRSNLPESSVSVSAAS